MIRVLHIGLTENLGGIESVVMNILRNVDRTKLQFDFLIPYGSNIAYCDEIVSMGGRVFDKLYSKKEYPLSANTKLKAFFNEHQEFDAIHIHSCVLGNIKPLVYAYRKGIKCRIVHSHNNDYMEKPSLYLKIKEAYNKLRLPKYATRLVACSNNAGEWMFGNKAFDVINNGIDTQKYSYNETVRLQTRVSLGVESKHVIGTVGRMQFQKNPEFIIDIFRNIRKIDSDAVLLYVGDGNLRSGIVQKIQEYGLTECTLILGNRTDVNVLLQAMDVFILPSRFEGLGIVLIEAQAAGMKCFTTQNVVPNEANVAGLVSYLSLNKSPEFWANEILKSLGYSRVKTDECIINSGYDIKKVARTYQHYIEETTQKLSSENI